jgi:hypothetical protein
MKPSASAWSFGKEKVRTLGRESNLYGPGPGQYESSCSMTKLSQPKWK